MEEVWKDVEGYEGLYQVSNLGNIRSMPRKWCKTKSVKILEPIVRKDGYMQITFSKEGISENFLIHRLVANAFIPNIDNLPQINHIDEVKSNNNSKNLEWCTSLYNNNYGTKIQRTIDKNNKKVNQYDLNGKYIKTWESIKQAQDYYNIKHISSCCNLNKSYSTVNGFQWRFYSGNTDDIRPHIPNTLEKSVVQRDLEGNLIKTWKSLHQISRETDYHWQNISKCCRGLRKNAHNFKWEYLK